MRRASHGRVLDIPANHSGCYLRMNCRLQSEQSTSNCRSVGLNQASGGRSGVGVCFVTQPWLTLCGPHGLKSFRLLCPWDFPGKNTGVGCHFLLGGAFPAQGLNPHLLHWQVDSSPLSHQGSPAGMERKD